MTHSGECGHLFRLTCSVVVWGGRNTANKQCLGHTGFAPTHSVCAFLVYTAQGPGCSAGELSKASPFPQLRCSCSGSWVLHRGTDSAGPAFCALPRSKQLRRPGDGKRSLPRCVLCLITSLVLAPQFPGCSSGAPSQVC